MGKIDYARVGVFWMFAFVVAAVSIIASDVSVFAIPAPATGTFAYDIYDVAVNDIIAGPIGFVGGAAAIIIGAVEAVRGRVLGSVAPILGGAAMIKAPAITSSLGCMIH